MITIEEKQLARECLDFALQAGAFDARITLTKSTEDLIATLDGQVDRVTRCADRSLSILSIWSFEYTPILDSEAAACSMDSYSISAYLFRMTTFWFADSLEIPV